MIFEPLPIVGAYQIDLEKRGDDRGFFARMFCEDEFSERGLMPHWTQVNTSFSKTLGTIRGMHFQRPPAGEAKLVRCFAGEMFDVIVDLRAGSPTFGQWATLTLTPETGCMIYVPEGVAHGFQTLKENTEVLYFHSTRYSQKDEGGLRFDDPSVGIAWPLPPAEMSARDLIHPFLKDLEPIDL